MYNHILMKKYLHIIAAFILTLCTVPAMAQDDEPTLRIGAKAGINLFNISDDPGLQESDVGLGTEFGFFGRIGDRFFVQPGVDFVTYKTHIVRTVQPRPGESDAFVARYLRVPVLIGYRSEFDGRIISYVRYYAGPAFTFNVGVKDNFLDLRRKNVRNAQFALNAGVGADIRFISLDLMYHYGFSTVLNGDDAEGKGRAFSIALGFSI